ncbi:MAG: serine/threonine-protein kinase [Planctomycetota bacterium]
MPSSVAHCPQPETLKEFLLGKLESPELDVCESHLSECQNCHETLRGMTDMDTFSEQVAGAMLSTESSNDDAAIRSLIDRLIDPDSLLQPGKPHFANGAPVAPSPENLELLADRAAEVLRCLQVEDQSLGKLGDYELIRLIGAGSSGVVFQAMDQNLNRLVAVKVLRPSLGQIAKDRFLAEARAAAAIDHANVVTVFQVGTQDRLAYMVMQWTPGETLESKLQRQESFDEPEIRRLAIEVASGLSAAHEQQMIHRDIKPANTWICDDGSIKLLDFGLARIADEESSFTGTGLLAGTPNFMSPEQSRGQELDERTDLFSLGCVLYRLLTNRLPFGGTTVLGTLQSIQNHHPAPIRSLNPDVSDDLIDVTMSLLAKQPANRPANARQLIQLLSTDRKNWDLSVPQYSRDSWNEETIARDEKPTKPTVKTNSSSNRRSGWRFVTAIVGLLFMSFGAWFAGPQIIRIATDQGELIIETNDNEDIEIEILKDGNTVRVVDLASQNAVDIKSGEYQIRAKGVSHKRNVLFSVSKKTFVMTRGGKEIIKVTQTDNSNQATNNVNEPASVKATSPVPLLTALMEQYYKLESELVELNYEKSKLVRNYGKGHPKIRLIEDQILAKKEQLDNSLKRYRQEKDAAFKSDRGNLLSNSNFPTTGLDSPTANEPSEPQNPNTKPIYNGHDFDHWINIAQTDRHTGTFADAFAACVELADSDTSRELVVRLIRKKCRRVNLMVVGVDDDQDKMLSSFLTAFRAFPKHYLVDFVVTETVEGNENSRAFCIWLTPVMNNGMLPVLTQTQRDEIADFYASYASRMIRMAYQQQAGEVRTRLLQLASLYTHERTTNQLKKLDPVLLTVLTEIEPQYKKSESIHDTATLFSLMNRYGFELEDQIDQLIRCVNEGTVEREQRMAWTALADRHLLPWPSENRQEEENESGRIERTEEINLRLQFLIGYADQILDGDFIGRNIRNRRNVYLQPIFNSIYQHLAYCDPADKTEALASLEALRKKFPRPATDRSNPDGTNPTTHTLLHQLNGLVSMASGKSKNANGAFQNLSNSYGQSIPPGGSPFTDELIYGFEYGQGSGTMGGGLF